jgi:putative membrane protein
MTTHEHPAGDTLDRIVRGVFAGGVGGLVGAGAKLLGELVFPPRVPGEPVPPVVMVSRIVDSLSGSPLLHDKEMLATQGFHWSFSILVGAAYGAVVEVFPGAKLGRGVVFGLVLCALTHESLLPLFGLSIPLRDMPLKEHASELLTHALFGLVVEQVRRVARSRVFNAHAPLRP